MRIRTFISNNFFVCLCVCVCVCVCVYRSRAAADRHGDCGVLHVHFALKATERSVALASQSPLLHALRCAERAGAVCGAPDRTDGGTRAGTQPRATVRCRLFCYDTFCNSKVSF